MIPRIHAAAGVIGFLCILTFWTSTVASELFGSPGTIAAIKNAVLWGMWVLVPSMAAAGGTGFKLLGGRTDALALAKKRRMMVIGPNGGLVLIPCAFYLADLAARGQFTATFYAVQAIELVAGLVNLTLMGLNIRDGLRLTGRIASTAASGSAPAVGTSPLITPRENGPLIVSGVERLQWSDGATVTPRPTLALCRCGASANKPFCDGSHSAIGFASAVSPDRTPDGATEYRGAQITVLFNRLVCSASENCAKRLPEVFRKGEKPWIVPDRADVQRTIEVVQQCPSGALRYAVAGRIASNPPRAPAIRIVRDGPYEVEGGVGISAVAWCEGASQDHFALCRCGQSKNKPFCDGSHHAAGFSG
jgi:CDGSH-type Zn-finger protein/ferredoxin